MNLPWLIAILVSVWGGIVFLLIHMHNSERFSQQFWREFDEHDERQRKDAEARYLCLLNHQARIMENLDLVIKDQLDLRERFQKAIQKERKRRGLDGR